MKLMIYFLCLGNSVMIFSCNGSWTKIEDSLPDALLNKDTISISEPVLIDSILDKKDSIASVIALDTQKMAPILIGEANDTRNVNPEEVIKFAETLVGTPYVYGSTDPKVGFDCSGFITYVFNNFKIKVPRSSVQFTNVGKTVPVESAKWGDIVLFTDPDYNNTNSSVVGIWV